MNSRKMLAWGAAEIFFVLSVLVAVVSAILSGEISTKLHLGESDLGLLSGVFFITYAFSQLIFGILITKVSARLVLALTAVLSSIGTLVFSLSDGLTMALVGRAVMGIGLSSTFVGVIYIVSREYKERFAFMSSLSQSITNLAAAALSIASTILPLLNDFRLPFLILTALLLFSALLLYFFVGSNSSTSVEKSSPSLTEALKVSVTNSQFWVAMVFYCGTFGTLLAFADLWNIQFQMDFFHHTVQVSAFLNSMIPLGVTAGGLVSGAWALRSGFVLPSRVFTILTLICFFILLVLPFQTFMAGLILFFIGFGFSSSTLGLAAIQKHIPQFATPLATSLVVTASCIFGGVIQPLVGSAISAPHRASEFLALIQSKNPDFATYQLGLIWLLCSVAIAVIATFFFRSEPSLAAAANRGTNF